MFPEIFTEVFSLEFLLFSGAIICRRFDVGIYYIYAYTSRYTHDKIESIILLRQLD